MHYSPTNEKCPLPYSPFKSCTVPRPIGWLSTLSEDGIANLAPYSQWQNLTFDPPLVMFAVYQRIVLLETQIMVTWMSFTVR